MDDDDLMLFWKMTAVSAAIWGVIAAAYAAFSLIDWIF
jgi:hypothetical protein